jgi:hypothetical protein
VVELLVEPKRLIDPQAAQIVSPSRHTYLRTMSEGVFPKCVEPDKRTRPNYVTISPRATVVATPYVAMRMRGVGRDNNRNPGLRLFATRMLRT